MGTIRNRANIGKTGDELVDQWNLEHPEDPALMPEKYPPSPLLPCKLGTKNAVFETPRRTA
jgi:hypothetical protein